MCNDLAYISRSYWPIEFLILPRSVKDTDHVSASWIVLWIPTDIDVEASYELDCQKILGQILNVQVLVKVVGAFRSWREI